jgi:O-antigen/teichoic acid export membrane protein
MSVASAGAPVAAVAAGPGHAGRELDRKIASGTAWNFIGILAERLVAFGVFALVVRHLDASTVGIVTLATVFIDLTLILTHGGLPEALVRHPSPTSDTFDTAFWTNIGFGCAMTLGLAALAQPIAIIYATPMLATVLYVLSAAFILTALGTVHQARLTRGFHFRALAARSVAATAVGGAISVAMSLMGYGIWALVAQRLVTVAVSTVTLWLAARWLPGFGFRRKEFLSLTSFGIRLTGSTLLLQLTSTVTLLIIGYAMNNAAVGYYRVAGRLYDMVNQFVITPITQVALAAFASVQTDEARFARLYARMTGVVSLLAIPTFFGMAALAAPLVHLVFGPQWSMSAPILAILCLAALPVCINIFVWPALTAKGAATDVLKFGGVQLASSVLCSVIAAPFGPVAVAIGQVVRAYAVMPYSLFLTTRHAGTGAKALMMPLLLPTVAATLMAGGILVMRHFLPGAGVVESLGLGIPLGIALYGVVLMIVAPTRVRETIETMRRRR